jgi:hypothetical protein
MSEMNNRQRLDEVLKAGIVIVAMLIGYFVGRNSAATMVAGSAPPARERASASPADLIAQKLSLPGVDWNKNGRTLILALQAGCHFCTESAPFYKRLVHERARFGNTKLVAVLPESIEQSKEYLRKLDVRIDDVLQGSLIRIGIAGTPTLLLVNSSGTVTEAWTGKLDDSGQEAVLAQLRNR